MAPPQAQLGMDPKGKNQCPHQNQSNHAESEWNGEDKGQGVEYGFGIHGVFWILIFGPKTQIFTPEVHGS